MLGQDIQKWVRSSGKDLQSGHVGSTQFCLNFLTCRMYDPAISPVTWHHSISGSAAASWPQVDVLGEHVFHRAAWLFISCIQGCFFPVGILLWPRAWSASQANQHFRFAMGQAACLSPRRQTVQGMVVIQACDGAKQRQKLDVELSQH